MATTKTCTDARGTVTGVLNGMTHVPATESRRLRLFQGPRARHLPQLRADHVGGEAEGRRHGVHHAAAQEPHSLAASGIEGEQVFLSKVSRTKTKDCRAHNSWSLKLGLHTPRCHFDSL